MRLVTPYAPTSFLKPCLVVSTVFNSNTRETAVRFVEALNYEHALHADAERAHLLACGVGDSRLKTTAWVVVKRHKTREAAVAYHLEATATFAPGGSTEEWEAGMDAYETLRTKYCPADFVRYPFLS